MSKTLTPRSIDPRGQMNIQNIYSGSILRRKCYGVRQLQASRTSGADESSVGAHRDAAPAILSRSFRDSHHLLTLASQYGNL
jgi:hypothetical protein